MRKVSYFHFMDSLVCVCERSGVLPPCRLFEMGFAEQLQEIIRRLPDTRQTLLFSATLPKLLVEFARAGEIIPLLIIIIFIITYCCLKSKITKYAFVLYIFPGLTEPVLIRLDVDSKLSDQIKVKKGHSLFNMKEF